jgi:hypothetical protein
MTSNQSPILTCTTLTTNIPLRMSAPHNTRHQPTTALVATREEPKDLGHARLCKLPEWSRQERRPDAPSFLNSLIILIITTLKTRHLVCIATSQDRHHDRPQWSCCGHCDVLQTSTLSPDSRTCSPVRKYFHLPPNARPPV